MIIIHVDGEEELGLGLVLCLKNITNHSLQLDLFVRDFIY